MTPTATALELVRLYGPVALCLFVFLETSMLFPFLPSEVVVPAAAALLVTDVASLTVFVAAATVGGTVGAFVPFTVARTRPGEDGWLRRHVRVSDRSVERGQAWFQRWGETSVLCGRFLPVVRSVVSIPAGLARMDPFRFAAFTAVGTAGFYGATGGLVYVGRRQSLGSAAVSFAAERPGLTALLAVLAAALGLLGRRWVGRRTDDGWR